MEGTNDVTRLISADVTVFNLDQMVKRARSRKLAAFLGLLLPRNQSGFKGPQNRRTDEVNVQLPDVARANEATLVDTYTTFFKKAKLYSEQRASEP